MFTETKAVSTDSIEESDSEDERIVLHVYDDESKEFTSLTTYHGMIRIYTSQTWPSRIFWGVVVITCVTLFMAQGGVLLKFYTTQPTATDMIEKELPSSSLPSISLCPYGFKLDDNLFHLLIEGDESAPIPEGFLNTSSKDILDFHSYQCEHVVEQVTTESDIAIDFCRQSRTQRSHMGNCFIFDGWSNSGSSFLKIKLQESFKKTVIVQIHDQLVPASRTTTHFWIKHGTNTKLSFRVEEKHFLPETDWGTCQMSDADNKRYSYSECTNKCLINAFRKSCQCHPFFDEAVNEHCLLKELKNCSEFMETTCHCPTQCHVRNFVFQPLSMAGNLKNETTVTIILNSNRLKVYNQYKRFKQIDLMSYFGGVMGLFLGMSCITLVEVLVYLVKTIFGTMNDTRHQEFISRLESCNDNNASHEEIIITKKSEKPKKSEVLLETLSGDCEVQSKLRNPIAKTAANYPLNLKRYEKQTTVPIKSDAKKWTNQK